MSIFSHHPNPEVQGIVYDACAEENKVSKEPKGLGYCEQQKKQKKEAQRSGGKGKSEFQPSFSFMRRSTHH
jgi:hypothetical protein